MKAFIAEHDGIYIEGFSVIIAPDRKEAKKLLLEKLKKIRATADRYSTLSLRGKRIEISNRARLKEIDITKPHATLIWDGDY